jgi:hypothetical protein
VQPPILSSCTRLHQRQGNGRRSQGRPWQYPNLIEIEWRDASRISDADMKLLMIDVLLAAGTYGFGQAAVATMVSMMGAECGLKIKLGG